MSKLLMHGRPYAVFDASNPDHRRWFNEFHKTSAWGRCPVRFVSDDPSINIVALMQRKMIDYYVTAEFSEKT